MSYIKTLIDDTSTETYLDMDATPHSINIHVIQANKEGSLGVLVIDGSSGSGHSIKGNVYGFYIVVPSAFYFEQFVAKQFTIIGKVNDKTVINQIFSKQECPHNIDRIAVLYA